MVSMQAGLLRHRVKIQAVSEAADAAGQIIRTWSTVATRWCSIEPLSGSELVEARQVNARVTHRVTLRHYSGLTGSHRFLFGTRALNILSVMNIDERDTKTIAMCEEDV